MSAKQNISSPHPDLHLAFDVGHSSIGWAVLQTPAAPSPEPAAELLGCGAVVFAPDDCLASTRRGFRRQRRHIRATRQRIARMRRLLAHLGVLTPAQLAAPGGAWPWLLAARVLGGGAPLTWPELWDVLRWYAHNRGYDANRAWSRQEKPDTEDSEKAQRAHELLREFKRRHGRPGTMAEVFCDHLLLREFERRHGRPGTLAEVVCDHLGVDPRGPVKSSRQRVRHLGAAFPREGVEAEVERILQAHKGILPGVDDPLIHALLRDHTARPVPGLRLPARYGQRQPDGTLRPGGLLFGQLLPRFDNRIIARCPIAYERVYQQVLTETGDREKARREAEKRAKVPAAHDADFHRFRWAMVLAQINIAVPGAPQPRNLSAPERNSLHSVMEQKGGLTKSELTQAVRQLTGGAPDNLDRLLALPDAERALVLDPVRLYCHRDPLLSVLWPALPARLQRRLRGQWRRGRALTVADVLAACGDARPAAEAALAQYLEAEAAKKKRAPDPPRIPDAPAGRVLRVERARGRAPHTREIMREAVAFVLATDRHPAEEGGPLYRSDAIREAQLRRALDEQTNNHLIRHRLKLLAGDDAAGPRALNGLFRDLANTYAGGDLGRLGRITIEVNRDLRELSGKTAQEQAQLIGQQLANFKSVEKKLTEAYAGLGVRVGPGLIRKGRIAEDLGWTCPYTGQLYNALDLLHRRVDKDHIIPRSERASDSLDSLVITFAEVNKWKGQRTALRFIEEEQGKPVPGLPQLSLRTLAAYRQAVEKLECFKGHENDQRRKRNRKRRLLLRHYVEKDFTPADLTQTSQLVRLCAQALQRLGLGCARPPVVTALPGAVTAAVRKAWNLTGCLAQANPLALNPDDLDDHGQPRPHNKTELRKITHLHHALDACVLALAAHHLPRDGEAWRLLLKRRLAPDEQRRARQLLGRVAAITPQGELRLNDLPPALKEQVSRRLRERRVVQHIPADLSGLRCEETVWRVFDPADPHPNARRLARWLANKNIPIPAPDAPTVLIISRKRNGADAAPAAGKVFHQTPTWRWVYEIKDKTALLGLAPEGDPAAAKLKRLKAVKVLGDNFGLALDPEPALIRPHKIWHQLAALRARNGGKPPRVLRIGSLIRVNQKTGRSDYRGTWRVRGVHLNQRAGYLVNLSPPDQIRYVGQPGSFQNVSVATLLKCGLEILKTPLSGVAAPP